MSSYPKVSEKTSSTALKRGEDRFTMTYRKRVREKLRAKLPVLTYRDIRRYREPYHYALCQELQEDGFVDSAKYVDSLLQLEQDIRQAAGEDSVEWQRPQLRNQMDFLDKLRSGLMEAEKARMQELPEFEVAAYLQLGVFFMEKPNPWWWLAEQLLLQAVAAGNRCKVDGGRRQAIARYVYGTFLLTQMDDPEEARRQLESARELAAGREWSSGPEMGIQLESVFDAVTLMLHCAMMRVIQRLRPLDIKKALRLSRLAVRRVEHNPNWRQQEAEALLEMAVSLQMNGEVSAAIETINRMQNLLKDIGPPESPEDGRRRCSADLVAAICYLRLGLLDLTLEMLQMFLYDGEEYNINDIVRAGHRYLGEFYLSQGRPHEATSHLVRAFSLYWGQGASEAQSTEHTRALAGVSIAHEHMAELQETLLGCTGFKPPALTRLLRWKDIRAPFWSPGDAVIGSLYNVAEEMMRVSPPSDMPSDMPTDTPSDMQMSEVPSSQSTI